MGGPPMIPIENITGEPPVPRIGTTTPLSPLFLRPKYVRIPCDTTDEVPMLLTHSHLPLATR